ncbi:unnamed protein product [marine sediment metagenome]|uniref:Uncharacterized protein n=1 Tax=marine sediment metagenome TaxID=412755 RepID=X1BFW3_9ZZZZ
MATDIQNVKEEIRKLQIFCLNLEDKLYAFMKRIPDGGIQEMEETMAISNEFKSKIGGQ